MYVTNKWSVILILTLAASSAAALALYTRTQPSAAKSRYKPPGGMECGHWTVFRTCELFGISTTPKAVRDAMPASARGHSLKEIAAALEKVGLVTRGRKEGFDSFLTGQGIRVVHMTEPDHFIVVIRTTPDRVSFFDNYGRHHNLLASKMKSRWSGNVLHVERPAHAMLPLTAKRDHSSAQPWIQLATLFIDHGDIPINSNIKTVRYEYPVRNAGTSDLIIKKIHTNCSCLVAEKPEHPIPPGTSAQIVLVFSVGQVRSAYIHEAIVETNDPAFPVILLRAAGNADVLVDLSPAALALGAVAVGREQRSYCFVRYTGEEGFTLQVEGCTVPGTTVKVREVNDPQTAARLWPQSHGRVTTPWAVRVVEVLFTPPEGMLGEFQGEIRLTTNIAHYQKMSIPIKGNVILPVIAAPALLAFGEIAPDARKEVTLTLQSLLKKPFRVVALVSTPGLDWSVATSTPLQHSVQVRIIGRGADLHKLSGSSLSVRIETEGKQFELKVPVYAWKPSVQDKASP